MLRSLVLLIATVAAAIVPTAGQSQCIGGMCARPMRFAPMYAPVYQPQAYQPQYVQQPQAYQPAYTVQTQACQPAYNVQPQACQPAYSQQPQACQPANAVQPAACQPAVYAPPQQYENPVIGPAQSPPPQTATAVDVPLGEIVITISRRSPGQTTTPPPQRHATFSNPTAWTFTY